MTDLHKAIQNREIYLSQKENHLKELRLALYTAHDEDARFLAMGDLFDEFRPYNTDSAFAYCKQREILALKTGNKDYITNAQLNTANVFGSIGMYKEALEIVDSIQYNTVPEYLLPYYFYIKRTVASYLVDFSIRKEDVSLRQLAVLLFQEGDIENAHEFLQIAMDDAQKCNARLRRLEINDIFPIVNAAFVQKIQEQKMQQRVSIVIISLLVLFLLAAIWRIWKQMKKTSEAHRETKEANNQLKRLNAELVDFNKRLTEANHAIAENSKIKEEYIAQFMDQCSLYIEKIDAYRKSLNKLLSAGKIDDLKKVLKSTDLMDDELKAFYRNFDATFLKLFPTFVTDFNKLLISEGQIVLKKEGQLNTELRVFALIRLGITGSVKIAQFLRYSVTTIYNYRTKTRNKALGNRNELEKRVMEIGRQGI